MEVRWQPKALKQLKKLGNQQAKARILKKTRELAGFPSVAGIKALTNHECQYRLRVRDYRVLFNVLESIEVIRIEAVKKRDEQTY